MSRAFDYVEGSSNNKTISYHKSEHLPNLSRNAHNNEMYSNVYLNNSFDEAGDIARRYEIFRIR